MNLHGAYIALPPFHWGSQMSNTRENLFLGISTRFISPSAALRCAHTLFQFSLITCD